MKMTLIHCKSIIFSSEMMTFVLTKHHSSQTKRLWCWKVYQL